MIKKEMFLDSSLPDNICFVDIETTGLSLEEHIVIISYAKYFNDSKCNVVQLISEDIKKDEKKIILEFLNANIGVYELYSFNGYEFEYTFLKEKIKYHDIDVKFDFKCSSLKLNIKHMVKSIGSFSRKNVENYFGIIKSKYYDMRAIAKTIKKENIISDDMIGHSVEEMTTLLYMYEKFRAKKIENAINTDDILYYLDDFDLEVDSLKLYFKSDKKSKYSKYFRANGDIIVVFQYDIYLEIFVKNICKDNTNMILYETDDEYIPLIIADDIIYDNIYFVLNKLMKG